MTSVICSYSSFFFNAPATPEIYSLSLHDALPISNQVPLLFLAAPLTGLLVQPIIGYMSDRTWHPKWGRRRPYFMIGAILDRKSTRLNSSHTVISYAVFCLKKKNSVNPIVAFQIHP